VHSAPRSELTGERLQCQPEEAFPHEGVEGSVLRKPLARQRLGEPELQNIPGLVALVWHHSSACTLATLSSSV
jgi:hypothetical protein